jgi:hypothetical protein
LLCVLAVAAPAAKLRIPAGSPYCAPPHSRSLFIAPMGEPFRADPGQPYPSARWFSGADADHDSALSRVEFVADAERFFRTLDRDHDGRLVPEEVIAYEDQIAPEIALYSHSRDFAEPPSRGRPKDGESGYGGAMGAGRYAWLNIPEPVASADADFDRVITLDEFRASASRRFDTLARGADRLTLAALPKTPMQLAIEGPCQPRPKQKRLDNEERSRGFDPDRRDREDGRP